MDLDRIIEKARFFLQQSRYIQAEQEIRQVLVYEPQHLEALQLLFICQQHSGRIEEALSTARTLLEFYPDEPHHLYFEANALYHLDKEAEAESKIRQAIAMNPYDATYFGMLSLILCSRKEWLKALEAADEGLSIDPENIMCLNCRTNSLTKLGRKDDATRTMEHTLDKDPENSYSHVHIGWAKLEQGNYNEAKTHFSEALRIEPSMEYARAGMIEALKAKNIIYRLFLSYFFWINKFQEKSQWGIFIGIYIVRNVIWNLADTYPMLMPLAILSIVFIYLTWIIQPLFNLFLRFDKEGSYALNERERTGSLLVGFALAVAIVSSGTFLFTNYNILLLVALVFASIVLPFNSLYSARVPSNIQKLTWYTLGLLVLGIGGLVYELFITEQETNPLLWAYGIGLVLFTWLSGLWRA